MGASICQKELSCQLKQRFQILLELAGEGFVLEAEVDDGFEVAELVARVEALAAEFEGVDRGVAKIVLHGVDEAEFVIFIWFES